MTKNSDRNGSAIFPTKNTQLKKINDQNTVVKMNAQPLSGPDLMFNNSSYRTEGAVSAQGYGMKFIMPPNPNSVGVMSKTNAIPKMYQFKQGDYKCK